MDYRSARTLHRGDPLSEFYTLRRRAIKDITGLIAFVIGWFASAPLGWPYITAGFENGEVTKGVAQFLVAVFGGACLSGIAGLALGAAGGGAWERVHRAMRARRPERASPARSVSTSPETAPAAALPPLPPIRYADEAVPVDAFLGLLQRLAPGDYQLRKAAAALELSNNVSAWDGDRLIGVARVLSDGYFFASLADILVDPDYQRRGVGRELMNRAFDRTPRGALFVAARGGSALFFDRLGCDRGPTGLTMHRRAVRRGPAARGASGT